MAYSAPRRLTQPRRRGRLLTGNWGLGTPPPRYTIPSMLRTIQATRYVLPLREGGSLPLRLEYSWMPATRPSFQGRA